MVGVATSRGCLACRKQKKKCIADEQVPPCQRCKRLGIDCLELGQRRLKFQSENEKFVQVVRSQDGNENDTTSSSSSTSSTTYSIKTKAAPALLANRNQDYVIQRYPSSALTRLRSGYIQVIDTNIDIAVQLPWNYGPYLEQVPRYIGRSKAFDAAAEALMASYSALRRNVRTRHDPRALTQYSKALRALGTALTDPVEATSTETLASIGMLMIFESIGGFGPQSVLAHAGGAAKVYKERGQALPRNEFEAMLQLSLRGAIVMQALFLPSGYFTDAEWYDLTRTRIGVDSAEDRAFNCFAVYARQLHVANALLIQKEGCLSDYQRMVDLKQEVKASRQTLTPELGALRQTFWYLTSVLNKKDKGPRAQALFNHANTYHAHIGRSYGFAIATKILINSLIQAINKCLGKDELWSFYVEEDEEGLLSAESADLARESCYLGRAVDCHRPLGTIYMAGVLRLAAVGADGLASQPVKALDEQDFRTPSDGHAPILRWFVPPVIHADHDPAELQDSMISEHAFHSGNNDDTTTVLQEILILLAFFQSDLEDPTPPEANETALKWLKRRFTFQGDEMDETVARRLTKLSVRQKTAIAIDVSSPA